MPLRLAPSSIAALGVAAALVAQAAPITIQRPFFQLETVAANSIGARPTPVDAGGDPAGVNFRLGADSVVPNGIGSDSLVSAPGVPATTGLARTTNLATGQAFSTVLNWSPSSVTPNFYFRSVSSQAITADPGFRGPWTLGFANGSDTAEVVMPGLAGFDAIRFVDNVRVSGSASRPSFAWDAPRGSVPNAYRVNIFDLDPGNQRAPGVFDTVFSIDLPAAQTGFTLPDRIRRFNPRTGMVEQVPFGTTGSERYAIEINAFVTRDGTGNSANSNVAVRSRSFFDFTPLPDNAPPVVYLPTIAANGAYQFRNVPASPDLVFIDPLIAIGYDYAVAAGDPLFAAVLAPAGIGDGRYDLWLFDASGAAYDTGIDLVGGVEFAFATIGFAAGVDRFRVLGIEISAGLDPSDPTAFVTGLRFASTGTFNGTQTPLTLFVEAPAPPAAFVLITALALLAACRRRRDALTPSGCRR